MGVEHTLKVQYKRQDVSATTKVITRYVRSRVKGGRIRDQKGGIWNDSPGIRDQKGGIGDQKGGIWHDSPGMRDHEPGDRDRQFF